jgi:hypothetical protein
MKVELVDTPKRIGFVSTRIAGTDGVSLEIGCIAHHHDFYWERERFTVNAVDNYLSLAFPPALEQVQHVTINTQAARDFSRRVGLSCRVIPNVMDFENPPPDADDYSADLRARLDLMNGDVLILQPTRDLPHGH